MHHTTVDTINEKKTNGLIVQVLTDDRSST
jgi:hypothetical protein